MSSCNLLSVFLMLSIAVAPEAATFSQMLPGSEFANLEEKMKDAVAILKKETAPEPEAEVVKTQNGDSAQQGTSGAEGSEAQKAVAKPATEKSEGKAENNEATKKSDMETAAWNDALSNFDETVTIYSSPCVALSLTRSFRASPRLGEFGALPLLSSCPLVRKIM